MRQRKTSEASSASASNPRVLPAFPAKAPQESWASGKINPLQLHYAPKGLKFSTHATEGTINQNCLSLCKTQQDRSRSCKKSSEIVLQAKHTHKCAYLKAVHLNQTAVIFTVL
eukprot:3497238-Amphidinium_carterae.1